MHATDMGVRQSDGRWLMQMPTYTSVGLLLPLGWAPFDMAPVFVGLLGTTPGTTTPKGTQFNMNLAGLFTVEFCCHEATHWWQANQRMGPASYWATYLWQAVLQTFKSGPSHVHETHEMEVEARTQGARMQALVLQLQAGSVFDVGAFLTTALPPLR